MHMNNTRVSSPFDGGECTTICGINTRTHEQQNARNRATLGTWNVQCAGKRGRGKDARGLGRVRTYRTLATLDRSP